MERDSAGVYEDGSGYWNYCSRHALLDFAIAQQKDNCITVSNDDPVFFNSDRIDRLYKYPNSGFSKLKPHYGNISNIM